MDGKVPTMCLRNKNAPKVLNGGTPEVSNQLVRTERRAHVEIAPSIMSGILSRTSVWTINAFLYRKILLLYGAEHSNGRIVSP